VTSKIFALNRIIGGWCRYYQYTSRSSAQFNMVGTRVFWGMAHWLGRKFKVTMPVVMQRFSRDGSLATEKFRLLRPAEFPGLQYKRVHPD
jgi:hypothetical protein